MNRILNLMRSRYSCITGEGEKGVGRGGKGGERRRGKG